MHDIAEDQVMGRVTTEAVIENIRDLWEAESGRREEDAVRKIVVPDALVDTGASTLSMPINLIEQLGLSKVSTKNVIAAAGPRVATRYSAVKLSIQGRDATVDVFDLPEGCPTLIGQIPLEFMDFVVDMKNQKLIGNPAHGGDWVLEMF